jgi:hypothetical protein
MTSRTWNPPPGPRRVADRLSVDPAAALPVLQRGWLYELTGIRNPRSEQKATCADCVMCGDVGQSGSRIRFSPQVKCCSYVPHLANFLAGRGLAGPGRASLLERLLRRDGVTPLGMGLGEHDLRRMVEGRDSFGVAPVVRCPHYVEQTQGCSIWGSRNTVCSTWFCRHDRGEVGQRFWQAVRDLLLAVEERVAVLCLDEGGLAPGHRDAVLAQRAAVRAAVARANDGDPDAASAVPAHSAEEDARLWGPWSGREEEWFAGCAQVAGRLTGDDLAALVADVPDLVDAVRTRWSELGRRTLPDRLRFTPGSASEATTDVLRLVGYSPFDPLLLPADHEPALWLLDGRPLDDVQAEALQEHAVVLDVDLLGALHDYGLAAPAPAPGDG